MKKIFQFVLAGILTAVGGMFVSDIAGKFLNGVDYGSACVLGVCLYLCAVVVTCTGIILVKLDKDTRSEGPRDEESHDESGE